MSRVKRMLISLIAVMAIGAVGASAASAGNTGNVAIPGTGSCDVTFDRSPWTAEPNPPADLVPPLVPPEVWKTTISNVQTAVGGTCDVDDVDGSGTLYKDSSGNAAFKGNFTFQLLSGFVTCGYTGTLTGTWAPNTNPPHNHKDFALSGTVSRTSGGFLCPTTSPVNMTALVDY